jgi:hypothetical protein
MSQVRGRGTPVRSQVEEVLIPAAVLPVVVGSGISTTIAQHLGPRIISVQAEVAREALPKGVLPAVILGSGVNLSICRPEAAPA